MEETSFDLSSMPQEPRRNSNLSICTTSRSTCCTTEIETQMLMTSRLGIERSIQDQLLLARQQFQDFATSFRSQFRHALNQTHRELHEMFARSYGPFYLEHRQIFDDFFVELDAFFVADYPNSNVKQVLARLFRKLYIQIFELLNPLRTVGEIEKECMEKLQDEVRPFGGFPQKIALLMERAFVAWKTVLKSIDQTNETLFKLLNDLTISLDCAKTISRMQQCHVCSGASPFSKPCAGFCLNTLKGCLAEFAEIDPQWNSLIESMILFGNRLKGVYNPNQVLKPLPVQISEAVMHFQEKGTHISNRLVLQCFSKDLTEKLRMKRSIIEAVPVPESPSNELGLDSTESAEYDDLSKPTTDLDKVKQSMDLFVDRLIRMKNFWRSLPDVICTEKRMAASTGETCWNGFGMGRYQRRVVGDGVASQRKNPEFVGRQTGSKDFYLDERIQFAVLSDRLKSLFYGTKSKSESSEGSGNVGELIDGSGLPPVDDEDEFNEIRIGSLEDIENLDDSISTNALPASTAIRIKPLLVILILLLRF